MESLTSGWRHFRLLADYAAVSPWLTQAFARSHVVEFPFAIGNERDTIDQILPSESWLPRGTKKILPTSPGQRFTECHFDFRGMRPPYPDLVMLGSSKNSYDFIYLRSISRGAHGFEQELANYYEYDRNSLDVLISLHAITRHKYEDRIPALRAIYNFGLSDTASRFYPSVLDDVAMRGVQDDVAAYVAEENQTVLPVTEEVAEAIYTRMLQLQTQICGFPRIPIASRRKAVVLRELDDHCAWWNDTVTEFVAGMSLLNCNNIVEQQIAPPPLNRAARRRGETAPPYRYHILKVRPFGSRKERDLITDNGQLMPLHWVKGHFKSYTPERPLLGRFSGRFWFQPHLAGRDTERIVAKSYQVTTSESNRTSTSTIAGKPSQDTYNN